MLSIVSLFVLYLEASKLQTTTAVSPACECVIYDGFGYQQNGTFMSPDWPSRYDPNIQCLLYTFVGGPNELVQITFKQLQLGPPTPSGQCLDFIRLFIDIDGPKVNERTPWQKELCGHVVRPGTDDHSLTFYSRGRALIFEFHSDSFQDPDLDIGFIGEFYFLDKRDYQTDGMKLVPSLCSYRIKSTVERKKGHIFSPGFPYHYPSNVTCQYFFVGEFNEMVRLTFREVDLPQTDDSCFNVDHVILVYDGQEPIGQRRRHLAIGGRKKKSRRNELIRRLCGKSARPVEVTTASRQALVKLRTGPNTDLRGRGFSAEYEFVRELLPKKKEKNGDIGAIWPPDLLAKTQSCNLDITSVSNTSGGTITSPNYPNPYGDNLKCQFNFHSRAKERVQLIFHEFDLFLPSTVDQVPGEKIRCRVDQDHFVAFAEVAGRMVNIGTFCGSNTPHPIMSSGPTLVAEFITSSAGINHRKNKGFKFVYQFVENFGITTGEKDPRFVCGFIYNSNDTKNGSIHSPNYPGYYPRNMDCHYEFLANEHEHVRIIFTYFDVEGFHECTNESQSDYVLFSNYRTPDRKNVRYCGRNHKPGPQTSENNFFRMIFHSNNIFDGTGFYALYQFTKKPQPAIKKIKVSSGAGRWSKSALFSVLLAEFLKVVVLYNR